MSTLARRLRAATQIKCPTCRKYAIEAALDAIRRQR